MSLRIQRCGLIASSGASVPFDPLATDLEPVGVWLHTSTSDNGTALTSDNLKPGGVPFVGTGVGRATWSATGLDGISPGITTTGMTVPFSAAIGPEVVGKTAMTVYITCVDTSAVNAYICRFGSGAGAAHDFRLLTNSGAGRLSYIHFGSANRTFTGEPDSEPLRYPVVICIEVDAADSTQDNFLSDGKTVPGAFANTPAAGAFLNRLFHLGSESTGGSPLPGTFGPVAIYARKHTLDEKAAVTAYLRAAAGTTQAKVFLWTGDSITAGNEIDGAQWRARIQANCDARPDGNFYRVVGPFSVANTPFGDDFAFAGGGNTIASTITNLTTYNIGTRYRPDIIPILLGTNDIDGGGLSNASVAAAYGTLLDAFSARCPDALIIVQKLLPRTDSHAAQVQDLNDNFLPAVVSDAVTRGVNAILDSTFADLTLTFKDVVHPNGAAGAPMGDAMEGTARGWAGLAP